MMMMKRDMQYRGGLFLEKEAPTQLYGMEEKNK
jgi:hypothetical protein